MKDRIKQQALSLGFDTVGFTPPVLHEKARAGLQDFIAGGRHDDMQWMEDKMDGSVGGERVDS